MPERLRRKDFEKLFGPTLAGPGVAIPQRCSRGHEFPSPAGAAGKVLRVGGERFCLVCLLPFLRQFCGTVAGVKAEDALPAPDVVTGRPDEYL